MSLEFLFLTKPKKILLKNLLLFMFFPLLKVNYYCCFCYWAAFILSAWAYLIFLMVSTFFFSCLSLIYFIFILFLFEISLSSYFCTSNNLETCIRVYFIILNSFDLIYRTSLFFIASSSIFFFFFYKFYITGFLPLQIH